MYGKWRMFNKQSTWNYFAAKAAASGRKFLFFVKIYNYFNKIRNFCYCSSDALRQNNSKHRLHTKLHFFINRIGNYHLWRSLFSDYKICGYTLFRPWWYSLSINPPLWWKDADFYSPHGIHPQTPTTHLNNLPIDVINWVLLNQQGSLWEKYELSSISSSSLFPLPSFHFFFVSSRGIHVSCIFGQLLPDKYKSFGNGE